MADAMYVVGDHRNGDAKIELDANKNQFVGLTKEELMKYADDPFWNNLRWSLFVLFWAAWLCLLAGAIVIVVRAPKCYAPEPKHWYEVGPLVEMENSQFEEFEPYLDKMECFGVKGIFMDVPTYDVLDEPTILEKFQLAFAKAKNYGLRVIVDLFPSSVSVSHKWFVESANRTDPYTDYFVWNASNNYDKYGNRTVPNNWVSTSNTSAWVLNTQRNEFYLSQFGEGQADLNFRNENVKALFDKVIKAWMSVGAIGVRLNRARHLLVDPTFAAEDPDTVHGRSLDADHTHYAFWQHSHTTDQPGLVSLFNRFASKVVESLSPDVEDDPSESVFTLAESAEETGRQDLYLTSQNVSMLRPLPTSPLLVAGEATAVAAAINKRVRFWSAMQLKSGVANDLEIAAFSMLLPAAPILDYSQISQEWQKNATLHELVSLREERSVTMGQYIIRAVPALNSTEDKLIACARWLHGKAGYLAVYNLGLSDLRANLTEVTSLPDTLAIYYVSPAVENITDYRLNLPVDRGDFLVPSKSTVVLSYVPQVEVEN